MNVIFIIVPQLISYIQFLRCLIDQLVLRNNHNRIFQPFVKSIEYFD